MATKKKSAIKKEARELELNLRDLGKTLGVPWEPYGSVGRGPKK
jgi:hypothetical protein